MSKSKLKVLVACEFSGIVRTAFRQHGHIAWSCDILPAEDGSHFHIQRDVRDVMIDGWDLMIAHPPCTYLCNSGVRWLYSETGRWERMQEAAHFFLDLLEYPYIDKIAVENPVMHGHTGIRKADFYIQPYQFGHGETKRTGFWTKNLPALVPTDRVPGRSDRVHKASPGPERWKDRSRTYPGVASAMAAQWGALTA